MKNVIKKYLSVLFLFVLIFTLFSCDKNKNLGYSIHTEAQANYLAGDYKQIRSYGKGVEELSKPKSITISWKSDKKVQNYKFYLSEQEEFTNYRMFETTISQIDLKNLKINIKYYWYVEFVESNVKSKVETFIINDCAPRNIDIDGVTNVRDIGGYKIGEKYTNQGLIYRSARFNENETTTNLVTDKGIKEFVDDLGVKTELDLRKTDNNENGGITSSPLGESVNYVSIPMKTGGNYMMINEDVLKDVFSVLGDKNNYPIVIHCSIGTDRTGAICFLINGLLGVEKINLYQDYLFSNFGNIGGNRMPSTIDDYIQIINREEGNTLSEKIYNYLIKNNVEKQDIDNLIEIMTK